MCCGNMAAKIGMMVRVMTMEIGWGGATGAFAVTGVCEAGGGFKEFVEEGFQRGERDERYAGEVLDDGAEGRFGDGVGVVEGEEFVEEDRFGDGAACG